MFLQDSKYASLVTDTKWILAKCNKKKKEKMIQKKSQVCIQAFFHISFVNKNI